MLKVLDMKKQKKTIKQIFQRLWRIDPETSNHQKKLILSQYWAFSTFKPKALLFIQKNLLVGKVYGYYD